MADVFISYAHEDVDFVRQVADALERRGKAVWVDWQDVPPSAKWRAEMRSAVVTRCGPSASTSSSRAIIELGAERLTAATTSRASLRTGAAIA